MKILALDSSGLVASVAVAEDDILLAEYTVNYKKTHSQTLLPMLHEVAEMTELDLKTVDAIAVAGGPGSFTGLRIGSATAKGLGLALDRPLISVPTVDALAWNLCGSSQLICPMMDARRNQVYTGIYRFEGSEFITIQQQYPTAVEEIAARLNELGEPVILLGDGIPVYRSMLEMLLSVPHQYAPAHQNRQRAGAVAALAMVYARAGKTETAVQHRPEYLRLSQAERERAAKQLTETEKIHIAEMRPEDAAEAAELDKKIFTMPWTEKGFLSSLNSPDTLYLTVRMDGVLIAYCGFLQSFDEADITNVAVAQDYQGRGVAFLMLSELMARGRARNIKRFTLEVRISNEAAIHVYKKLGFHSAGIRKNFYERPREDALIMWTSETPESES